jgi:hypothetical protein
MDEAQNSVFSIQISSRPRSTPAMTSAAARAGARQRGVDQRHDGFADLDRQLCRAALFAQRAGASQDAAARA